MSGDQSINNLYETMMIRDTNMIDQQGSTNPLEINERSSDQTYPSRTDPLDHTIDTTTATTSGMTSVSVPIRVPGTCPPTWVPDHEANSCMACESPFTIIKRRHHCRSCGKIFCGDCCKLKARLLYMDNKEARVCNHCFDILEQTIPERCTTISIGHRINGVQVYLQSHNNGTVNDVDQINLPGGSQDEGTSRQSLARIQGVLKSTHPSSGVNLPTNTSCNTSSASSDQHSSKQVMFSDGIRPGTDLSEPGLVASSSGSSEVLSSGSIQNLLTRQLRRSLSGSLPSCSSNGGKKGKGKNSCTLKNITVCDEQGYLPPIVMSKDAPIMTPSSGADGDSDSNSASALTNIILSQFKSSKKTIHASMESRSCPLNEVVKFSEISELVGLDGVVTFLLLKDFELKVKLVKKGCCINRPKKAQPIPAPVNLVAEDESVNEDEIRCLSLHDETQGQLETETLPEPGDSLDFWCFLSQGLERLGQSEVLLVLDKEDDDPCIPRDVFKIYLTLHELALRRQALEHLGNLLFQDGLFGYRETAGLLLVQPPSECCLKNLIIPPNDRKYLIALVLQRWEVPWSKVFPMRLLLRLGYKFDLYPYPIVSFRSRDPVYYEIGHTIISILGDFRNFRYTITHVDGLRVVLNKSKRKVSIRLAKSSYRQFNKVLDSANNEHVLAWSSCPFPQADGHLVCVQNEDGQYETVEFSSSKSKFEDLFLTKETGSNIGASFVVFSGALKFNQTGQPAKISIVEDGLLIQIQSSTMSALRNAIHFMHHFDIDCESERDPLNRVEINWLDE